MQNHKFAYKTYPYGKTNKRQNCKFDFILKYTDINDSNQFNCHKLVKKDADIDKLSYISFKIDVHEQAFEQLIAPEIWPDYVRIREFIQTKPVTLREFLDEAKSKQRKFDANDDSNGDPKNDEQVSMQE